MTEPLALVVYERLLPGSQLVNRLQDLSYRVHTLSDAASLVQTAEQVKPLVVLADLEPARNKVLALITRLRQNPATQHLPIIAFSTENTPELESSKRAAGVTLLVSESAILTHLPQFLEQALQVD